MSSDGQSELPLQVHSFTRSLSLRLFIIVELEMASVAECFDCPNLVMAEAEMIGRDTFTPIPHTLHRNGDILGTAYKLQHDEVTG